MATHQLEPAIKWAYSVISLSRRRRLLLFRRDKHSTRAKSSYRAFWRDIIKCYLFTRREKHNKHATIFFLPSTSHQRSCRWRQTCKLKHKTPRLKTLYLNSLVNEIQSLWNYNRSKMNLKPKRKLVVSWNCFQITWISIENEIFRNDGICKLNELLYRFACWSWKCDGERETKLILSGISDGGITKVSSSPLHYPPRHWQTLPSV